MDDKRLEKTVHKAGAGDHRAFGRIYEEYVARVYAFVRGRLANPVEAEDVTAAVFMRAWEALPRYDARGVPFASWLFRIARNAVIDTYRREARKPPMGPSSDAEDLAAPYSVEEHVLDALDADTLMEAVSLLTDEQTEVVMLRFFAGLSSEQTAHVTGRTEGAVKAMQHRALASLRRILGSREDDGSGR